MKKLGFKLLLSGVALAACAATLSTTTYAWYITNAEATATDVKGTTAAFESGGSVFVAKSSSTEESGHTAFGKTVSFATDSITSDLNPVTKNAAGTGWQDVAGTTVNGTPYMTFDIWVMSDQDSVNFELQTTNTSFLKADGSAMTDTEVNEKKAQLQQTCYEATGAPTAGTNASDKKFIIDAVEALRMEIFKDDTSIGTYDVKGISGYTATPANFTSSEGGNALDYYTAVLGSPAEGSDEEKAGTATLTSLTLTPGTAHKFTFRVWLEGTDLQCFDSCAGQSFKFDFTFSTTTTPGAGA